MSFTVHVQVSVSNSILGIRFKKTGAVRQMIKDWHSALKITNEYLKYLFVRFKEDRIIFYSGYLSYVTLLSMVPLLAVTFSAFSLFPVFQE